MKVRRSEVGIREGRSRLINALGSDWWRLGQGGARRVTK